MISINKKIKKFFSPHWLIVLILTLLSAAGLFLVFRHGMEKSVFAFCVYPVSAYTLGIDVFYAVRWIVKIYRGIRQVKVLQPYFQNREFRKIVSMGQGLVVSFVFAVFKLVLGVLYQASWELAVGGYYLVLCLIRANLMRVVHKGMSENQPDRMRTEWINMLRTGILMFLLNVAMTSMAVLMIWENKGNAYPGFIIYLSALHAFYALIHACVQMFRFRKSDRPVFYSVNVVNLAGALMSILILQVGLLQMFSESALLSAVMNTVTATVVLASVFAMAVLMVVQGLKELKRKSI